MSINANLLKHDLTVLSSQASVHVVLIFFQHFFDNLYDYWLLPFYCL